MHVAIIMDGNGRWAAARGLPRAAGHREGVKAVCRAVEAAHRLDVSVLTLYAFSGDNWQRPEGEVTNLMRLFEHFLRSQRQHSVDHGIRVSVIGRRDRLSPSLRATAQSAEAVTASGDRMHLRIAVDYSARGLIVEAARRWHLGSLVASSHGDVAHRRPLRSPTEASSQEEFARILASAEHSSGPVPDVDLLIRTGGEQRLSDFLLWESAYAELIFIPKMWPDFRACDLEAAILEFHLRERRFGRVPAAAAS